MTTREEFLKQARLSLRVSGEYSKLHYPQVKNERKIELADYLQELMDTDPSTLMHFFNSKEGK